MESLFGSKYLICSLFLLSLLPVARSSDAEALLSLKASIDPSNTVKWRGSDFCKWRGVKECIKGRVTKLVLEFLQLDGNLEDKTLNQLDQLRVLSFKGNLLSGPIPNLSNLTNLKSLYLNNNNFSGVFPSSISSLHRLKVLVLFGNAISGEIPASLIDLPRLYVVLLQDNAFTGRIPALNQESLSYFNVSNNRLSGEIPSTPVLLQFNSSSFSNNLNLCGEQIRIPCKAEDKIIPPNGPSSPVTVFSPQKKASKRKKIIVILSATSGVIILLLICLIVCWKIVGHRTKDRKREKELACKRKELTESRGEGTASVAPSNGGKGFSWESEGLGTLVFCGGLNPNYSLEDLLKASAETMGRGTMGSTYKAVMESGFIVTVKRLKDSGYPEWGEFRRHMEVLGNLGHPNLVPVRAYFQAKQERLLVYDYFPNGSLFSLIHGSRPSSNGKPLHWTSCLKIAEDLASGLVYIHQTSGLFHGNLKSSNVLLGPDFESCITDFGLYPFFRNPNSLEDVGTSLFYRAPECRHPYKSFSQQSDVYSYGVLLLELLTGKTPFQDLVQENREDIPQWVRSIREEETESGEETSGNNGSSQEKLGSLLNIAMACISINPESRPLMKEVLRMINVVRAESQVSPISSDNSPGRWSDTVQGVPKEHGSEHLSLSERD